MLFLFQKLVCQTDDLGGDPCPLPLYDMLIYGIRLCTLKQQKLYVSPVFIDNRYVFRFYCA